jgi:hypothetical protein
MSTDEGDTGEVLTPTEQDSVPFYGRELLAVRLADGRIAAVLRWMCEALGVGIQQQMRHIRGRVALSDGLVTVRVQTPGGPQAMPALTLDVLPSWLMTIDERRVKPEVQADIVRYQRECAQVLGEHFARKQARELPAPSTLVPSEPITRPVEPGEGAPLADWREYYRAMIAFLDWQEDIETWRGNVETRLEEMEELTRLVPEILDRLGPATLTPAHQATVRASVKRLADLTGASYGSIYADLGASFHVAKYADIIESEWPRVAEWFRARITGAEKHQQKH